MKGSWRFSGASYRPGTCTVAGEGLGLVFFVVAVGEGSNVAGIAVDGVVITGRWLHHFTNLKHRKIGEEKCGQGNERMYVNPRFW